MSVQEYFPFIDNAQVIKVYTVDDFDFNGERFVEFDDIGVEVTDEARLQSIVNILGLNTGTRIPVIRVVPNNVYLLRSNNPAIDLVVNSPLTSTKFDVVVTDVDYGRVADLIEIVEDETMAVMQVGGGYAREPIKDDNFVKDAQLGVASSLSNVMVEQMRSSVNAVRRLNEDDLDDLFATLDNGDPTTDTLDSGLEPPFYDVIMNYLKSDRPTEKIPILVGMSGIAKSAMVKDAADVLNMRMIDLRVSFMKRLDIDGLSEVKGKDVGMPFTENSPMMDFLVCTDEYLAFARASVVKLEAAAESIKGTDPDKELELQMTIEQFKEMSKTPVLFFDEITRSAKDIRGALTTIINQRIFGAYHLKEARMIAATNANVGYEDDDMLEDLFVGASISDVAVLDRFNKIPITPEDAYPRWIKYITGKGNFHDMVIDYVSQNPDQAYDMTDAVTKAHDYDKTDDLIPAYPTFRAWQFISEYLTKNDYSFYSEDIILGLLGETAGKLFIKYLQDHGYVEQYADATSNGEAVHEDRLTEFVEDTLEAGLPAIIMGVSGLGKTTRVREYCERHGYIFNLISMATKGRQDIMGTPAKVNIINYIAKDGSAVLDELGLIDELRVLQQASGLPDNVTIRAPKSDIADSIREAKETGKTVVFFFDEFNRCLLGSTKVKLLDSRVRTMKELYEEYGTDGEFWVYGCDTEGNFVPGKAHHWGVTRKDAEVVEVVLDNGESVICTPDHPFMLRDGSYVNAENLLEGTSLMAAYFSKKNGRETISIAGSSRKLTHRLVGDYKHPGYIGDGLVCHHVDEDIYNNTPDNLLLITQSEHMSIHYEKATSWRENPTPEQLIGMQSTMRNNFKNNIDKRESNRLQTILDPVKGETFRTAVKGGHNTDEYLDAQRSRASKQWESGQFDLIDRQSALMKNRGTQLVRFIVKLIELGYEVTEDNYEELREQHTGSGKLAYRATHLNKVPLVTDFNSLAEAINEAKDIINVPVNHKVVSVNRLDYKEDVYDIYVEGCHNFLSYFESDNSGVFVHNCIDPVAQSAIFTAISDSTIGGVSFPKDQVKIVMAGNLGESTQEAGAVDGALLARGVQYKKMEYDLDDAKAVVAYMKSHGYADTLLSFLDDDFDKVLDLIRSVDDGSITANINSTRSLQALSDMINESADSQLMHGAMLCPDSDMMQQFYLYAFSDKSVFDSMLERIKQRINNWAMIGNATYPGGAPLEVAIDAFNKSYDQYKGGRSDQDFVSKLYSLMDNFLGMDKGITDYREKTFSYYVSKEFARDFVAYYNINVGVAGGSVSIDDLYNEALVATYVKSQFTKLDQTNPEWSIPMLEISSTKKDSFSTKTYWIILLEFIKRDVSTENSRNEMIKVISDPYMESVIIAIEGDPEDFRSYRNDMFSEIYKSLGFSVNEVRDAVGLKNDTINRHVV